MGFSLVPEFRLARGVFRTHPDELYEFLNHLHHVLAPNNRPPAWVGALSPQRKALRQSVLDRIDLVRSYLGPTGIKIPSGIDPDRIEEVRKKFSDRVESVLNGFEKDLRSIEILSDLFLTEKSFPHGPFRVYTVPGVTRSQITQALEVFDLAMKRVQSKFPQLLYGEVYLATKLAKTRSGPHAVVASYAIEDDTIQLSLNAKSEFGHLYAIVHELGHRLDHKFVRGTPPYREFYRLSTEREFESFPYDETKRSEVATEIVQVVSAYKETKRKTQGFSLEAERWITRPSFAIKPLVSQFLQGRIDADQLYRAIRGTKNEVVRTDRIVREPIQVTPYGATSVAENFAEGFAHYVLDLSLPPEIRGVFDAL